MLQVYKILSLVANKPIQFKELRKHFKRSNYYKLKRSLYFLEHHGLIYGYTDSNPRHSTIGLTEKGRELLDLLKKIEEYIPLELIT